MNLIKIDSSEIGGNKINSVDTRELHGFLGSKQDFSTWVKNKVVNNPFFEEGQDFILLHNSMEAQPCASQPSSRNRKDYAVTLDTAKKVAMSERTARGEEARNYFLECERRAKEAVSTLQVPQSLPEALRLAADQAEKIELLEVQKKEDAPRVEFARVVEGTDAKLSIGAFAKLSGKIGRNNLFKRMREAKILMPSNQPYQRFIDSGYFETSESIIKRTTGDQIVVTPYLTGKGQVWLSNKVEGWA